MKAQMQKGFTLIELMIVVAIIGILAAVAIPQYQNYVGRANFASGLSTITALKTNIEDHIMEKGAFPTNADLKADGLGLTPEANDLGKITLSATEAATGAGDVIFTFEKGNPGINGLAITLTRSKDGNWTCSTPIVDTYAKGCTTPKDEGNNS